jgi:hypothetical protein
MTERRESKVISRAARRMAEAAEEISRSVARVAEHELATEQAYRFWENFVRKLEEGSSTGSWGPWWRTVPFQPTLSEEDAVLLAVQSVREVREELWGEREAEVSAPGREDIERWLQRREDRREREGDRLP